MLYYILQNKIEVKTYKNHHSCPLSFSVCQCVVRGAHHSSPLCSLLAKKGTLFFFSVLWRLSVYCRGWVKIGSQCRRPHPPRPRHWASASPAAAGRTRARCARATVATGTSTVTRTATGHRSRGPSRATGFVRRAGPRTLLAALPLVAAHVPRPPTSPPSCEFELSHAPQKNKKTKKSPNVKLLSVCFLIKKMSVCFSFSSAIVSFFFFLFRQTEQKSHA